MTALISWHYTKRAYPTDIGRQVIHPLGDVLLVNMGLLFILATRTCSLIEMLCGIPFERAIVYHKWVGRFEMSTIIVHASFGFDRFSVDSMFNIGGCCTTTLWGFIAGSVIFVAFNFTWQPIRRNAWEVFYYAHQLMSVGAIFALVHVWLMNTTPPGYHIYITSSICEFCMLLHYIDRFIRFYRGDIRSTELLTAKPEQIEVTRIEMKKSGFTYEAGQYCFVCFPEISRLSWHPFSLSSAPHEDRLTMHIKDSGGYTNALREKAKAGGITKIKIDGPYGRVGVKLSDYKIIVLIAGGVGVTPMISILKDLLQTSKGLLTKVYFMWTVRDPLAFEWFAEPLKAAEGNTQFDVKLFCTRGKPTDSGLKFSTARPKFQEIFNDIKTKHVTEGKVAVLACGPEPMVEETSLLSITESNASVQFHYHKETFCF